MVFLVLTVLLGGAAAWSTGRAIAETWKPYWQLVWYVLLLAAAVRFIHFGLFEEPLANYSDKEAGELADAVKEFLRRVLNARGGRSFGICRDCVHHQQRNGSRYCALLAVDLREDEAKQICFEQVAAGE